MILFTKEKSARWKVGFVLASLFIFVFFPALLIYILLPAGIDEKAYFASSTYYSLTAPIIIVKTKDEAQINELNQTVVRKSTFRIDLIKTI